MKIRSFRSLNNNVYRISIQTEDWSQQDLRLMAEFGEPSVDLGGEFEADTSDVFELPARPVRVKSDIHKMIQDFDGRDNINSKNRAMAWETEMISRLTDSIIELRTNIGEQFAAETVTNLDELTGFTAERVYSI